MEGAARRGTDSPLWALYHGTYTAQDFDTDEEDALRVGKQLAALNVIVDAPVRKGIIVSVLLVHDYRLSQT